MILGYQIITNVSRLFLTHLTWIVPLVFSREATKLPTDDKAKRDRVVQQRLFEEEQRRRTLLLRQTGESEENVLTRLEPPDNYFESSVPESRRPGTGSVRSDFMGPSTLIPGSFDEFDLQVGLGFQVPDERDSFLAWCARIK
jgi:hypothetical protein